MTASVGIIPLLPVIILSSLVSNALPIIILLLIILVSIIL